MTCSWEPIGIRDIVRRVDLTYYRPVLARGALRPMWDLHDDIVNETVLHIPML